MLWSPLDVRGHFCSLDQQDLFPTQLHPWRRMIDELFLFYLDVEDYDVVGSRTGVNATALRGYFMVMSGD